MARIASGGYGHRIRDAGHGVYVISWQFDVKLGGSRLRSSRVVQRDTDREGAERFAKRWGLSLPAASGPARESSKPILYKVRITREIRFVAEIELTATSEKEAIKRAVDIADAPRSGEWIEQDVIGQQIQVNWTLD